MRAAGGCGDVSNETECGVTVPGMRCVWDQGTCRQRRDSDLAEDVCHSSGRKLAVICCGFLIIKKIDIKIQTYI